MVSLGIAPIVMPVPQLIDHTGWATTTLGLVPTIAWSLGPCQSALPTGPRHACGQVGHLHQHCLNKGVVPALAPTTGLVPDRVQHVSNVKETCNVSIPVQLFNRPVVALLDMGCNTSIIGPHLLPKDACIQPTTNTLLAANSTAILLEGE